MGPEDARHLRPQSGRSAFAEIPRGTPAPRRAPLSLRRESDVLAGRQGFSKALGLFWAEIGR